jgi:NAD(P)-dependent dehydrogenase (short-subunit alcohol dehydrogenase family)
MSEGQVCAIVGAGEGLGVSLARTFAAEGMHVAVLSRTEAGSAQALSAAQETAPSGRHQYHYADATNPGSLESGLAKVEAAVGPIDLLIYNVRGSFTFKPPLDVTADELRAILELEVVGALAAAQAVIPGMIARSGGTVIYSSATAAFRGSPRNLAYAAAKFGLRGVAQSLAKAYASKGVHVAHVRLDCALDVPIVRELMGDRYRQGQTANPDDVARSYLWVYQQPRSAWSNEIELRPWTEEWTF